jgi:hypothetical protein
MFLDTVLYIRIVTITRAKADKGGGSYEGYYGQHMISNRFRIDLLKKIALIFLL